MCGLPRGIGKLRGRSAGDDGSAGGLGDGEEMGQVCRWNGGDTRNALVWVLEGSTRFGKLFCMSGRVGDAWGRGVCM